MYTWKCLAVILKLLFTAQHAKPALSHLECPKTVEAEINSTVILRCIMKGKVSAKFPSIEWVVNETTDVHLYRNKVDDLSEQAEDYKGRTSLFNEEFSKGNFSLNLRAMQSHAGTYRCTVKINQIKHSCSSELIFRAKGTTSPSQDPRKFHGKETTRSPPNSTITDITISIPVVIGVVVVAAVVAAAVYKCNGKKTKTNLQDNNGVCQQPSADIPQQDLPLMEKTGSSPSPHTHNLSNVQQQPLLQT